VEATVWREFGDGLPLTTTTAEEEEDGEENNGDEAL
jgi:hypothetical protein